MLYRIEFVNGLAMRRYCETDRTHQVNQQHPFPRNGRENGHCVRVGDAISWGTCSFERNVGDGSD